MTGKLWGSFATSGLLLGGSFAVAQSPRKERVKVTPLIISIQGPAFYCASCHGVDAKGEGPVAKSLNVKPSDLTRIAARSGGKFP